MAWATEVVPSSEGRLVGQLVTEVRLVGQLAIEAQLVE